MAKFKTRGGKTVVFGSEAIGINDPLLGVGIAIAGKKPRTMVERKAKLKQDRDKRRKETEKAVKKRHRKEWIHRPF